ncbi:Putative DNA polymerase, beta domain protein region [Candidatus Glomeribacter gigasporarum BEG34]|uniref:Putative DNA polymerase, beta domain protein region n=1 Tax=Candidatus Glomeribacter gigasporarum BEG34 TaxID=1070319 RepID=G2J7T9_9BURK|nr:nucleotidyltransferase domain-containing protein [Candidatus Glomeribacter gigasporarum]CCD28834.1 Putative DNA polymerase, beta domain protein region [Candidatus Glomeribacter gigasporarum BEG34]
MSTAQLDPETERAARVFLERIKSRFNVAGAILFGSRARRTHRLDSDADIAVIIREPHGKRSAAAIDMAGVAFDVLLETDVLVEALPLWEEELIHPEYFSHPDLIENIRREGIRL